MINMYKVVPLISQSSKLFDFLSKHIGHSTKAFLIWSSEMWPIDALIILLLSNASKVKPKCLFLMKTLGEIRKNPLTFWVWFLNGITMLVHPLANSIVHWQCSSRYHQRIQMSYTPCCRHFDPSSRNRKVIWAIPYQNPADVSRFWNKTICNSHTYMFKFWSTGAASLPQKDHLHYDLLNMQYYECKFVEIIWHMKSKWHILNVLLSFIIYSYCTFP